MHRQSLGPKLIMPITALIPLTVPAQVEPVACTPNYHQVFTVGESRCSCQVICRKAKDKPTDRCYFSQCVETKPTAGLSKPVGFCEQFNGFMLLIEDK